MELEVLDRIHSLTQPGVGLSRPSAHSRPRARCLSCVMAAVLALLCLPVGNARAQGYLFGRAAYALGGAGTGPAAVAVGDFSGDGMLDLAVVQSSLNRVAILLGKADGTLAPAITYPTGSQPVAVVVGDFNGDGRQDLAVANQNCATALYCGTNGTVSILLGRGDGTFQPQTVMVAGAPPTQIAVGDLNNDGKADLVLANGTMNSIVVLLGNGDGTFQAPLASSTPHGAASIALGDFNRDGRIDLAVGGSSATISILWGKGDGTFQFGTDLPLLSGATAIIVDDFNGDGAADLAVASAQLNSVSVLLGNGDGTFQIRADYSTGVYPTALTTGDFNSDGRLDLVVANSGDQTFSVLLGHGDGTFETAHNFALAADPTAVAVGDVNRDGKADLAVVMGGSATVSIIVGLGDGTFPAPQPFGGRLGSWAIAAGDFDGDGKLDLVTTNLTDNSISVFPGGGDGTLAIGPTSPAGPVPVAAIKGDFNRDGKLDLAVVNQTCTSLPCANGSVSIFLGNGDGTFQPRIDYPAGEIPTAIAAADFNGDGILDLAVVNNGFGSGNSLTLFIGNGDGTFHSGGALVTGVGPTQAVAADFNGDGTTDLAVGYAGGVSIIPGRGAGTFGPRTDYPIPNGARALVAADFNHDGKLDLAVSTFDSVQILLGNGDGTLSTGASYVLNSVANPDAILAGDFSGSGKLDLLVGKSNNAVSVLVGNGDGTFQPAFDVALGGSERGWAASDFNGDGGLDLAAASVGPNAVFVALNAPVAGFYPGRLDFGAQGVGTTSAPLKVTVSNPSGAPLAIASATASGPFAVANDCPATLAPGSSCALSITFSPTAAGNASGVLTISDNTLGGAQYVRLHGIGVGEPAAVVNPSSLSFAPQALGTTSASATVTLSNPGGAALSIAAITASGDFAATDNCPPSLAAGAQCAISVTFAPTEVGRCTGVLTVSDNAPSSPQTLTLTGTGVAKPIVGLSDASLAFGNQRVHTTSAPETVTLSNSGNAPLLISNISTAGDFSAANNCPASLDAGASCTISVSFAPTAAGTMVGAVTISDNAADSPQSVTLTGTGTAPMAALSPVDVSFANQTVGSAGSSRTITLSNSGTAALTITGVTLSGANAGDFSWQNQCGDSLGAGMSCGVTVVFAPAAAGTRSAALNIATDAGSTPQSVALTGAGVDFSLSPSAGSTAQLTVTPGQQAVFHLTVAPMGWQSAVSFSCAGVPAESTCQVSPAMATLDGVTPASVTVAVQTTAPGSAILRMPAPPRGGSRNVPTMFMLLTLLALTGFALVRSRRRVAWGFVTLVLPVILFAGCGGGQLGGIVKPNLEGTPSGSYTLKVTASSAGITHSATLNLTVQ